ncbi:MAG: glycosyltransferase 87 family protein [Hyphomicrobiaceae bacterium]
MPRDTRPVRIAYIFAPTCRPKVLWYLFAIALIGFSAWISFASVDFGYDTAVIDMPVISLVVVLFGAGLVYVAVLPRLISDTIALTSQRAKNVALWVMVFSGLAARLILFASEPMLENDYQRYLWDGAVSAHAINPYRLAPKTVEEAGAPAELVTLKDSSGRVFDRINYKHLTTIYPPVAQAAFALAHIIKPWQLWAWRVIVLATDLAILALLFACLKSTGRSRLWAAIYWCNPLVLKEVFNSAHMDGLVVAFVLAALLATIKSRNVLASLALACAVGAKLWPALLAPLFWRHLRGSFQQRAIAIVVFFGLVTAFAMPVLVARLDANTGLVAYAQSWKLNSPLFHGIEQIIANVLRFVVGDEVTTQTANLITKILIASGLSLVALICALKPGHRTEDLIVRILLITVLLVFTAPAAYPWYTVWFIPLLAFYPNIALTTLTATMALYYLRFHFGSRGDHSTFNSTVSLFIWGPVWALCFWQLLYRTKRSRAKKMSSKQRLTCALLRQVSG